jgi:hypothetical protein
MSTFTPASETEIQQLIMEMRSATCNLDPLPTSFIKQHIDVLITPITKIVNESLKTGTVPDMFKHAEITPILKKENLDKDVLSNYRPISNLQFLSKLTEKLVCCRLKKHLEDNKLWSPMQSAYRQYHSTETALIRVQSDIIESISRKKLTALILLDLSAAFDTVDHQILLSRLQHRFGINGQCLQWFSSYLCHRHQSIRINNTTSEKSEILHGVPQGSVLGPLLFTLYMSPISDIIDSFSIGHMLYADDSQLYISMDPKNVAHDLKTLENCIGEIKNWMIRNMLKLNDNKTEFLILGTKSNLKSITKNFINIGLHNVIATTNVRNLGAYFDSEMSMNRFVTQKTKEIQYELRKLFRIRHFLTFDARKSLIQALIISRLDYCCTLLIGTSKANIRKLQVMQNNAARFIYSLPPRVSAKKAMQELHWLPIEQRIKFRTLTYTYKSLQQCAPSYINDLLITKDIYHHTRASAATILFQPKLSNNIQEKSFKFAAPKLWNELPSKIRSCVTTETFKKQLKTFLFKQAYF